MEGRFWVGREDTADDASTACKFSRMMMEGTVRASLKLSSDNSDTSLLSLDETIDDGSRKTVRNILKDKHPVQKQAHPEVFLGDIHNDFHPAVVDNIAGESICVAPLHIQGAAGPSGLDVLR